MRLPNFLLLLLLPSLAAGQTVNAPPDAPATMTAPVDGPAHPQEVVVLPEVAQTVEMNNADFNRITCPGGIKDIVYSKEKGLVVKFSGNNAFIKFKYLVKDGKPVYAKNPVELDIVCDGDVYTIIALPRTLASSPKIRLSSGRKGRIGQNASVFSGMPMVKKCAHFVKLAYKDAIPASFDIVRPNKQLDLFKGLRLVLRTQAVAEGEGLQLKEYDALNVTTQDTLNFTEKDFLVPEIASSPLWISFGPPKYALKPGDSIRIFVVERTGGERE
jgi:conjugal transfer pilus assembly protein TraK